MKGELKKYTIETLIKTTGFMTIGIIFTLPFVLFFYSLPLLKENSIVQLLFSEWDPENKIYGLGFFILSTAIMGVLATIISVIISLAIVFFIYHNKKRKRGKIIRKLVEIMSGIPTVVYGFAGVVLLVPFIRKFTESPTGLCLLSATLMLSVLILPTIVMYMNQSLEAVSASSSQASLALGATKLQFYYYVLIPESLKGILIAVILGFSRAVSDTMIALMISGNAFKFPKSLLESSRSLTAHIALVLPGEFDGIEFKAVFFTALLLMIFIFIFNLIIQKLDHK